jgi:CelD/BcsL family acetyltransferase involved in cellulose biosynthesis
MLAVSGAGASSRETHIPVQSPIYPVGRQSTPVAASGVAASVCEPDAHWDELVAKHPEATIFHTSAWARVLMNTYGHRPFYLRLLDGDDTVALVPLMEVRSWLTGVRAVCLPFSDECPPLVFRAMPSDAIRTKLADITRQHSWKHCEVRGDDLAVHGEAPEIAAFVGHRLNLRAGREKLQASFDSAVRRGIRKAEKHGLVAAIEDNRAAMDDFYRLHCATRRRHGVPPQPRRFFGHIYEQIIRAGKGFIATTRKDGRCIAAAVFLCHGHRAIYKFGASARDAQDLRPNNLCFWRGIAHLADAGYHTLDFGRTDCGNEGLRRFKRGWGSTEYPIHYIRFTPQHLTPRGHGSSTSSHVSRLFRLLPLTLNRALGEILYVHLD